LQKGRWRTLIGIGSSIPSENQDTKEVKGARRMASACTEKGKKPKIAIDGEKKREDNKILSKT